MRLTYFPAITLLLALFALPAQAQHAGHHPPSTEQGGAAHQHHAMHEMRMGADQRQVMAACLLPELGAELQLSDDQQAALEALRSASMEASDAHAAVVGSAPAALEVLTDEQRTAFYGLDESAVHTAMMAHMHAASEAGMTCPMMAHMTMPGAPEPAEDDPSGNAHQH